MGNIQIKRTDFDNQKRELQRFANNLPAPANLPKLETEGWFFGLNKKTVTGAELNDITNQINKTFIDYNNRIREIIGKFGTIYKTFETLDKEYISGIIRSVEAAEEASNQALNAGKEALRASDQALESSRNALIASQQANEANTKIQVAQNDINNLLDGLKITVKKLGEFKTNAEERFKPLEEMLQAQSLEHYKDIDIMFDDIQTNKTKLIDFKKFRSKLEQNNHLFEIDEIWNSLVSLKQEVEKLHKQLEEEINILSNQQSTINEVVAVLKNYKESSEEDISINKKGIALLQDYKQDSEENITQLFKSQKKIEKEASTNKIDSDNKLKRTYWIAGIALAISLIQFFFILFKLY